MKLMKGTRKELITWFTYLRAVNVPWTTTKVVLLSYLKAWEGLYKRGDRLKSIEALPPWYRLIRFFFLIPFSAGAKFADKSKRGQYRNSIQIMLQTAALWHKLEERGAQTLLGAGARTRQCARMDRNNMIARSAHLTTLATSGPGNRSCAIVVLGRVVSC